MFVRGDVSSQFLSALLMALPSAREATTVEVQGVPSCLSHILR